MDDHTPFNPSADLRRRVDALEARGELVEGILDLSPGTPCRGRPGECGAHCTKDTCPLSNNRIHDIGSMMQSLLDEILWVRCMADEMDSRGEQYAGFSERVQLRVRRANLQDEIHRLEDSLRHARGVTVLAEGLRRKLSKLKRDLSDVEELLAGSV